MHSRYPMSCSRTSSRSDKMMEFLRVLFPQRDRRSPERFRDARVQTAVQSSERTMETSRRLQRELKAIESSLREKPCDARRDR